MSDSDIEYEKICDDLWGNIQSDNNLLAQANRIFNAPDSDLDRSFLGFVGVYYYLSKIIPKGRCIYDLGCCNAFQSWFFKDHKKYVGVDAFTEDELFFKMPNSEFHHTTTKEFLDGLEPENPHFAICNYVPPWCGHDSNELVRAKFDYVFVYYPETGDDPEMDDLMSWKLM